MAALPNLITVEEFRRLPESGEYIYELHSGEIVAVPSPRPFHYILQRTLSRLLDRKLSSFGEIFIELPYRAVPEFDFRVADVGIISKARYQAMDRHQDLAGAPDLVVEVISPSNTKSQLRDTVAICLNNGSTECWLVDPTRQSVTVIRKDGSTSVYTCDSEIPLAAFGSDSLAVSDIFKD
jgi:Uma2 family endonuclease